MRHPSSYIPSTLAEIPRSSFLPVGISQGVYAINVPKIHDFFRNIANRLALLPLHQQLNISNEYCTKKVQQYFMPVIKDIINTLRPFLSTEKLEELEGSLFVLAHNSIKIQGSKNSERFKSFIQSLEDFLRRFAYIDDRIIPSFVPDEIIATRPREVFIQQWKNRISFNNLLIQYIGIMLAGLEQRINGLSDDEKTQYPFFMYFYLGDIGIDLDKVHQHKNVVGFTRERVWKTFGSDDDRIIVAHTQENWI